MTDALFHPAVEAWFWIDFEAPSPIQTAAWPAIAGSDHTLLAAPTGTGKTLAAFLAVIDNLLREGLAQACPSTPGSSISPPQDPVHRYPAQSTTAADRHRGPN